MRTRRPRDLVWWVALAGLLLAGPILAQNPTGTLTGTVTDADGGALPGVTVVATSPSLQGERTTSTGLNGAYKLAFLPPGDYRVTYQLDSFATAVREVKISAAQTTPSDIELQLSELVEEIVVTGRLETISETNTVASTYTSDEVESLPVQRDITETVALAPGVQQTGPVRSGRRDGNVSISGAMSFENLWLINGVVVNENLRGQPLSLFIEDAIQETTAVTGGVSAEYGRFTGGVVNVITKSGGNDFSGSLRVNFENESWEEKTPLSGEQEDTINDIYEATFGGPILGDRLWFFLAGRDRELSETDSTSVTNITFPTTDEQTRLEGKLTLALTPSHSLVGSYLEVDQTTTNDIFGAPLDLASLTNREDPQEIVSGNYTGILSPSFFLEAQYSERELINGKGSGGPRDKITGSPFEDTSGSSNWNAPFFCAECEDELRNNENALVKGSYFLITEGAGTHDISVGYDSFTDIRFAINHQSGSDFRIGADTFLVDPNTNEVFPVVNNVGGSWVGVWPVVNRDIAQPTDFKTNSYYINDKWQLNDHWSVNLGARLDENDGTDSGGNTVADDRKVSPRLGIAYDVKGDGDLVFNASAGTYVAAVANTRADATSQGGSLGRSVSIYGGPTINLDAGCVAAGTCLSNAEALQIMFDWYFANGGVDFDEPDRLGQGPNVAFLVIPGSSLEIPDTIKSPSADEITLGLTKRLGTKGLVRADLVYRDWTDFYSNRTTLETGTVIVNGVEVDRTEVGNFGNSVLEREYTGLHTQARYRLNERLTLAGTYTLSRLEGNIDGETTGSGPVASSPLDYPEYKDPRWNVPVGDLGADRRHKLRLWAVYDLIDNERHSLNVALLQNFLSGTPYGATGAVSTSGFTNPGYLNPDPTVTYFFTNRDAFLTDDVTRTDLSLNYAFRWSLFGKSLEVFLQPEVINIFDEQAVISVDTTVFDATNDPTGQLQPFDPFTETPVEGTHWRKGDLFGQPTDELDYQEPRTFRFSVGFRF